MNLRAVIKKNHVYTGHQEGVYALSPAHDPQYFYSAGSDGFLVEWNVKDIKGGRLIAQFSNTVYALALHPTKNWLYVGQNTEGVHLIDLDTCQEIKSVKISQHLIFDISFFQNKIIVASGSGRVIVLNAETLETIKVLPLSSKNARTIAVNSLANEFAVGYSDKYIRVFDAKELSLKYEFKAHESSVFTLSYSHDCQLLFSGGKDAYLKVWDAKSYASLHNVVAHMHTINQLVFSPKGYFFATCSMDKSIKIWSTDTLRLLKVIDKGRYQGHHSSVNKLLWLASFEGSLISCSDDRQITSWGVQIYRSAT